MFLFLFLFSLIMAILLYNLPKKTFRPIFKSAVHFYTLMFSIISLLITVFFLYNNYDSWKKWLQIEPKKAVAYATTEKYPHEKLASFTLQEIPLQSSVRLDVPLMKQYPELPRGCEVTSLAMLLKYYDVNVSKMQLAKEITKDKTKFTETENGIFFGNPSKGFVGNMYSLSEPGYGVYHQPIAKLASSYVGEKVIDFTGGSFFEILQYINQGRPVWVITNSKYKELPKSEFETWETEDGPIEITMREHSVLVTGYDRDYVYFNDPITGQVKKAAMTEFEDAWVQMGKQAITVIP
ncbi:C39 family peptidase [Aquibacillus salsiterrae]|uniref:C39 family peptidase n=1 Tax=Aquibacillus salsiterrae TaxID=2950439 RepID=A0A9X4AFU3_9BACI|nr:C39 family peptidase [Aquibacillus salsiterrae]MDC3418271.1 C39 family peptidase [Aquibacillus salsiterrae]